MIQHGEVGGQQKGEFGNLQIVNTGVREPLHPAYRVVAEITNQAGCEGRQVLSMWGMQQAQRLAYGGQRVSTGRQTDGCMPEPDGLAVLLGQRGGCPDPDEGVARPYALLS